MDILMADCSLAEFGWELMSWQGYIRRQSVKYDKVIVCTTRGREYLYADFTSEFRPHSVPLLRDCFEQRKIYDKPAWDAYRASLRRERQLLEEEGHNVKFLKAKEYIPIEQQSFIRYGDPAMASKLGRKYDIVLHARNKESNSKYYRIYNWPLTKWNPLVAKLKQRGFRIAAIGTKDDAFLPTGADDLRGIPMSELVDIMSAAKLVIGPSSGPMHLAALCKAPHFVWTGKQWSSTIKSYNDERYRVKWNPLHTMCDVITSDNPDMPEADVYAGIEKMLQKLKSDDAPDDIPGTAAAHKMLAHWEQRVERCGRNFVSNISQSPKEQDESTAIVKDELRDALDGGVFDHGIDFGCGWGRLTPIIAEYCEKVTAADMVSVLDGNMPNHVEFQKVGFPTQLDIPDESVDLLVAVMVFQHIVDDDWFEDVCKELRRVLADSATIIIVDDNGVPAPHVRQRPTDDFKRTLDIDWCEDKMLHIDSMNSHRIVVGAHRKD